MRWLPAAHRLMAVKGRLALQATAGPDPQPPIDKMEATIFPAGWTRKIGH
jgi:hypothetical protein